MIAKAKSKSKQEVVSEFRKVEILDAARKVFIDKGFRDATVDDIAEAAGISKGTVYLYFPSKQEIYVATIERLSDRYLRKFEDSLRPGMTARDVVFWLAMAFMEHLDENKDFVLICIADFGRYASEKSLPEPLRRANKRQTELLQAALEAGIETGQVRGIETARIAAAIIQFVKNWTIRRTTEEINIPAIDDANMLSDLIWKGISQ